MSTPRQDIRDRIVELLKAGNLSLLGVEDSQILTNQVSDISDDKLPVVVVYGLRETADILSVSPVQQYRRILQIAIDVVVKKKVNGGLQDDADELAHKVESIMLSNFRDHGSNTPKWNFLTYRSMDANLNDFGDGDFSITRLLFDFTYDTEVDLADLTDYPTSSTDIKGKIQKTYDESFTVDLDPNASDEVDLSPPE